MTKEQAAMLQKMAIEPFVIANNATADALVAEGLAAFTTIDPLPREGKAIHITTKGRSSINKTAPAPDASIGEDDD